MAARIPFTEGKSPVRGVLDLATGCYPRFLFGGSLGKWLPVFHFHEVTPAYLDPYLAALAANGYRTVTSDAIARYVRDGRHPGPNSVALCFDDAWASLWTVAAPLLKRYGFQAITYVSPVRVSDAATVRPTLDQDSTLSDADRSATPFATWPELRALQASGVIDVQAHTLRHAMVFCDETCTGFVTPDLKRHVHLYPWVATAAGDRFLSTADLGAPLYTQRSRYSDALRIDRPEAFERCTRHVREHGAAAFFQRPGWEQELRALADAAAVIRETPARREAAIREELGTAREILNQKLGVNTVRHMCFPWAVSGSVAERLAAETGYETAFADRLFGHRAVRAGDPPYRLMRLKHQFITCLPGTNRRTFFTARKASPSHPSRSGIGDDSGRNAHAFRSSTGAPATEGRPTNPRICLLTGSFHPVVGGGETHARLLCAELRRRGTDVFVLTRHRIKTTPAFEVVDDIPVHRVPPSGVPRLGKYLMMLPAFFRLIRMRREYDLIYVCGLRILGIVGALAALLLGKRCVLRSESRGEFSGAFIWQGTDGKTCPGLKTAFIIPILLRNTLLKKADAFLSISGVIREEYEACGIAPQAIASIPNGIDTSRFTPVPLADRAALRRRLNLPGGHLFAYTGKLNRGKGLEFIVRVWKDWVTQHPDCRLVLVGSGAMQFLSCETELRDYVREHGLEKSVLFMGNVTNVHEYLQAADFFVFPSESEALPLALLEALASGLPTAASDIGGVRDILTDGVSGRLLPVNDAAAWTQALTDLVGQPDRSAALAKAGRATVVDRFSMTRIATEHLDLFRAICARAGGAR
jgi:glycosyltransferase involved in cell wall biosynthesis/peptidoglycan/xylan/chitin deacetylase (PgdA/CDA1 family)